MNYSSKQNGNKKSTIIFMIMTFVLLYAGTAFGQTTEENNVNLTTSTLVNNSSEGNVTKQEAEENVSNMNFVLWFMGSKQDPNAKVQPAGVNTKKQFMTSGTAPNRLLIKAFLKKAVNFENAVV